jgi:hypothetical protein
MRTLSRKVNLGVLLLIGLVLVSAVWGTQVTTAQTSGGEACAQLLPNIEQHVKGCQGLEPDQVCYGNKIIAVEYTEEAGGQKTLAKEGDIAPLNTVKSLTAGPLNPERDEWGVAVLKTQPGNLEGTTGGQVVTFIVYGDTTVTGKTVPVGKTGDQQAEPPPSCDATTTRSTYLRASPGPNEQQVELLPANTSVKITGRRADGRWVQAEGNGKTGWLFMDNLRTQCDLGSLQLTDPVIKPLPNVNAFFFSTGVGAQSTCKDIPPAGMFVQSPKGIKVTFRLNGADIVMGSTADFSVDPGPPPRIKVKVIEGEVQVIVGGKPYTIRGGTEASFPLGGPDGLQFIGPPGNLLPLGSDPTAPDYVRTLCDVAEAAGLTVTGCDVQPPVFVPLVSTPTPTQEITSCSERTFLSNGRVCIPNIGIVACDRNGKCDDPKNGENSYTCPEDCGPPPPKDGWGGPPKPPTPTPTEECFYCSFN